MATKPRLVLTNEDMQNLISHVTKLPFKRKNDQRFLDLIAQKSSLRDFSDDDFKIVQRCRYERNAHQKKMQALAQIKHNPKPSVLEKKILELAQKTDIDSYFLMLDSLKIYLDKNDLKLKEMKLNNQQKKREAKTSTRKQNDHEKYYLGATVQKFLKSAKHLNRKSTDTDLDQLFKLFRLYQMTVEHYRYDFDGLKSVRNRIIGLSDTELDMIKKIEKDARSSPRNPFDKKVDH
jgi:hypothetical protein